MAPALNSFEKGACYSKVGTPENDNHNELARKYGKYVLDVVGTKDQIFVPVGVNIQDAIVHYMVTVNRRKVIATVSYNPETK